MLSGSIPVPNDVRPSKADMISKAENGDMLAGLYPCYNVVQPKIRESYSVPAERAFATLRRRR